MCFNHLTARVAAIRVIRAVRSWVDDSLSRLDQHLCALGLDEDVTDDDQPEDEQPEPCICGSTEHTSVRVAFTRCDGLLQNGRFGSLPVDVVFAFDESDPYAVGMKVRLEIDTTAGDHLGYDEQYWEFARDILDTAISHEDERLVGEGDVSAQYIPSQGDVWLWLTGADNERHRLDVDADAVTAFLQASFHLVPHGEETAEVVKDAEIERLLNGTWGE